MAFKLAECYVELETRDQQAVSGLRRFNSEVKSTFGSLKEFDTLAKLTLGIGAGGAIIGGAQAVFGGVTRGIKESIDAGGGLKDTFEDIQIRIAQGLPVVGAFFGAIKTNAEQATERTNALRHSLEALKAARAQGDQTLDALQGRQPDRRFPNLPFGAEASLSQYRDAMLLAQKNAQPGIEAINRQRNLVAELEASGTARGRTAGPLMDARETLERLEKQWAPLIKAAREAEAAWQAHNEALKKTDEQIRANTEAVNLYVDAMTDAEEQTRQAAAIERRRRTEEIKRSTPENEALFQEESYVQAEIERQERVARVRRERDERIGNLRDSLDPLSSFRNKATEIERAFRNNDINEGERNSMQQRLMDAARPDKNNRSEFVGFEEMARRIQQGANKSEHEKKTEELQTQMVTILETIRDNPGKGARFS